MVRFALAALAVVALATALTACPAPLGASCGQGGNICSGKCIIASSDRDNCGACGHACLPGAVCTDSACGCPNDEKVCGGACVDAKTDVKNCGACGNVCPGGDAAACTGGACELTIASGQARPQDIAVTADGVFWTNEGTQLQGEPNISPNSGTVLMAPLTGGTSVTLATGLDHPGPIAADGANVYWIDAKTGNVLKAEIIGGSPVTVFAPTGGGPIDLCVDSGEIYWVDPGGSPGGLVVKTPTGGGAFSTIATAQLNDGSVAALGGDVYWATAMSGVSQGDVVTPNGGGFTTLASNQIDPIAIAVDSTNVYWITTTLGALVKASRQGGTPVTLTSGQTSPNGIAADGVNVYWTTGSVSGGGGAQPNGTIMKMPIAGGTAVTVAGGQVDPRAVVVDSTSVYWVTGQGGTVMRVTPK